MSDEILSMSPMNASHNAAALCQLADELEACLPEGETHAAVVQYAAQFSPLGAKLDSVFALIAALRTGDLSKIAAAFFAVLDAFKPATGAAAVENQKVMAQAAAGPFGGFFVGLLSKIMPALLKLLPLILGL